MDLTNKRREATVKGIVGGTLSLTLASLIVKVLGLIYKIPLSYILGDEGMGYFNSAYTVYSVFYLLSVAGVPKAITILVSEFRAKSDFRTTKRIYKTAIFLFTWIGIFAAALLMLFSGKISLLIGSRGAMPTILVIAPSIIFTSVCGVVRGYLGADMRFGAVALSQIIDAFFKAVIGTALAVWSASRGYSVQYIAAFTILGATLGSLLSMLYLLICVKNRNKDDNLGQNKELTLTKRAIIKRIFSIALPIMIGACAMSMTNIIDLLLIMRRLGDIGYSEAQAGALYGNYTTLVVPMLNFAASVITPISVSVMPAMAHAYAASDNAAFKSHLTVAMRICSFIAVPITFGLMFYGKEVLCLIFDNSGAETAAPLIAIASTSVLFMAMINIVNSALEASGLVSAPIYTMLAAALIKVFVSYTLIGNSNFGISGAPIGTVISYAAAFILGAIIMFVKIKSPPPIISSVFLPFVNSVLMIVVSDLILERFFSGVSVEKRAAIAIILCMLVYIALSLIEFLLSKDKNTFSSKCTKNCQKNY